MSAYIGKAPTKRKQSNDIAVTSNQWQSNPKQLKFCEYYLDISNKATFGNAYASAIMAGYSENYARQLTSPAVNNLWVQEYKRLANLSPEHITQGIQDIAINGTRDSDKLRAYELLAKLQGLLVDKSITAHVSIEQALAELK
jgi:hypothetical protein